MRTPTVMKTSPDITQQCNKQYYLRTKRCKAYSLRISFLTNVIATEPSPHRSTKSPQAHPERMTDNAPAIKSNPGSSVQVRIVHLTWPRGHGLICPSDDGVSARAGDRESGAQFDVYIGLRSGAGRVCWNGTATEPRVIGIWLARPRRLARVAHGYARRKAIRLLATHLRVAVVRRGRSPFLSITRPAGSADPSRDVYMPARQFGVGRSGFR